MKASLLIPIVFSTVLSITIAFAFLLAYQTKVIKEELTSSQLKTKADQNESIANILTLQKEVMTPFHEDSKNNHNDSIASIQSLKQTIDQTNSEATHIKGHLANIDLAIERLKTAPEPANKSATLPTLPQGLTATEIKKIFHDCITARTNAYTAYNVINGLRNEILEAPMRPKETEANIFEELGLIFGCWQLNPPDIQQTN